MEKAGNYVLRKCGAPVLVFGKVPRPMPMEEMCSRHRNSVDSYIQKLWYTTSILKKVAMFKEAVNAYLDFKNQLFPKQNFIKKYLLTCKMLHAFTKIKTGKIGKCACKYSGRCSGNRPEMQPIE